MHLCWYRLLVQFDRFISIYKLGLVLEGLIPHILVGSKIHRLGLALRGSSLLDLVLYFGW
jgi:hypothetical protein